MPTIIIQPQDGHQPSVGVNDDLIGRLRCSICVCVVVDAEMNEDTRQWLRAQECGVS